MAGKQRHLTTKKQRHLTAEETEKEETIADSGLRIGKAMDKQRKGREIAENRTEL